MGSSATSSSVTERTFFRDPAEAVQVLKQLQEHGVRIALDGFGTGYSSLSQLKDLPLDTIKIDRAFVRDLSQPRLAPHYALALVRAITTIAETLDRKVVAEGIESEEVARTLQVLGCYVAQGYFLPGPCPPTSCGRCSRSATAVLNAARLRAP